jgi:hypothetical protein
MCCGGTEVGRRNAMTKELLFVTALLGVPFGLIAKPLLDFPFSPFHFPKKNPATWRGRTR